MSDIKCTGFEQSIKNYLPGDSVACQTEILYFTISAMIVGYKRPSDILKAENIAERWTKFKDKNSKRFMRAISNMTIT